MLEQITDLPTHPLVVHAAVVFVPMLALAGIVYAVVPSLRGRIAWAAALLAVLAPVAALLAKETGEQLEEALTAKNYPPQILDQVAEHSEYADVTFGFTLGLGVATALLVVVTSGHPRVRSLPAVLRRGLGAIVVVLGVISAFYIYRTGETGAEAVWSRL